MVATLRSALGVLRACLRHLADEDAWERYRDARERSTGRAAEEACCPHREGSASQPAGNGTSALDRGRFWQQETERRWSGVRRCC